MTTKELQTYLYRSRKMLWNVFLLTFEMVSLQKFYFCNCSTKYLLWGILEELESVMSYQYLEWVELERMKNLGFPCLFMLLKYLPACSLFIYVLGFSVCFHSLVKSSGYLDCDNGCTIGGFTVATSPFYRALAAKINDKLWTGQRSMLQRIL
jgi:hypothetical protein